MLIRGIHAVLALLLLLAAGPPALAQQRGGERAPSSLRWSGSARWDYYQSQTTNEGTSATFDSLRQRYTVGLAGSIWDPRFSRFSLAADLIYNDRDVDGVEHESETLGYRGDLTLFPARPFPLHLYARRTATDVPGRALAASDRASRAWGANWNLALRTRQKLRLSYEDAQFELTAPVVLDERRQTGLAEYSQQIGRSDIDVRYSFQDQKELVGGSQFERRHLTIADRTQFSRGTSLTVNAQHTLSDALFSTGDADELTANRVSAALATGQRGRTRWTFGYDFNDTDARFVESTSHNARVLTRITLSDRWEANTAVRAGRVESRVDPDEIVQNSYGASVGARCGGDAWGGSYDVSGSLGVNAARADLQPDKEVLTASLGTNLRVPTGQRSELSASASYRLAENDTVGLGSTFDEARFSLGAETSSGTRSRLRGSIFYRMTTNDTFQFGVQESNEIGFEGSMTLPRGSVSGRLSRSEGISDFIPDPASGDPFTPGADLVNESLLASVGVRLRLWRRLGFRMQSRIQEREFTSIGDERILSVQPEIDWTVGAWRFALGYSRYERDNTTSFSDETWRVSVERSLL